ncbi:17.1 kDa class II heat shock protein-like [Juglans microcarpa x Juglans regia]|uniref:17.1 kDa class II heat shock protein-like n=1 Tax=Juglans microcarpa x Juglans regia TaxID=2249226 RepID=UPI001B7E89D4|nr:17.1 kDa class II heat shock protein-like [Juglans microcarpa x Juglans regia]
MENVRDTRGYGRRTSWRNAVVEELVPSSGWTEDPSTHYLLVDLPGFKNDEIQFQITGSGNLMISGERKVHEDKIVYFEQTFTMPKNTNMDEISGEFRGKFLYVIVPKQAVEEKRAEENVEGNVSGSQREDELKSKGNVNVGFSGETTKDLKNESETNSKNVVEMLKKNKGILMTAILAFSLGVLVTCKMYRPDPRVRELTPILS